MLYGNGLLEDYVYNDLGQVTEVYQTKNNGTRTLVYSYLYTDDGALVSFENHLTDEVTVFRYDAGGRMIYTATAEADAYEQYTSYEYNDEGLLMKKTGEGMTTELIYDGICLISVKQTWYTIIYLYDDGMTPIGMLYRASSMRCIAGTEVENKGGNAIYKELGISKFVSSVYLR